MGAILYAAARGPWPPLLFASLAGWIATFGSVHWLATPVFCSVDADFSAQQSWQLLQLAVSLNPPAQFVLPWLLMMLAMMPPLLAQPVSHLWTRSLTRRRAGALLAFIAAYIAIWIPAGLALNFAAMALKVWSAELHLPAIAVAVPIALLWQASPAKQSCLNRCHFLPSLSIFGLPADWDCLRYGFVSGAWCIGACWALMLVPLVAGEAHMAFMTIAAILMLLERQAPAREAKWRLALR